MANGKGGQELPEKRESRNSGKTTRNSKQQTNRSQLEIRRNTLDSSILPNLYESWLKKIWGHKWIRIPSTIVGWILSFLAAYQTIAYFNLEFTVSTAEPLHSGGAFPSFIVKNEGPLDAENLFFIGNVAFTAPADHGITMTGNVFRESWLDRMSVKKLPKGQSKMFQLGPDLPASAFKRIIVVAALEYQARFYFIKSWKFRKRFAFEGIVNDGTVAWFPLSSSEVAVSENERSLYR